MTCDECGARGPGLSPVVVGGHRKTLCATCNPYSPVQAVATDRLRATDGGPEVEARDTKIEDQLVDDLVDLLTIKTRRSGRGSWSFSTADLTGYLDCDQEDAAAAVDALGKREKHPISIERSLTGSGDQWVARPVPGGSL